MPIGNADDKRGCRDLDAGTEDATTAETTQTAYSAPFRPPVYPGPVRLCPPNSAPVLSVRLGTDVSVAEVLSPVQPPENVLRESAKNSLSMLRHGNDWDEYKADIFKVLCDRVIPGLAQEATLTPNAITSFCEEFEVSPEEWAQWSEFYQSAVPESPQNQ